MDINLGLQLYSIRNETERDFFGALEGVARMGFTGVEFAGYGSIRAGEMRAKLDSLGLFTTSVHHGHDDLMKRLDEIIAYNRTLGNNNIVCAGSPFGDWETCGRVTTELREISRRLAAHGMKLYYHNHSHEFVKFEQDGGRYAYDVVMEGLGDVGVQLDIYWLYRAGVDAIEYLDKYKDRTGKVEIKKIVSHAQSLGVKQFILEDESESDQLGAVRLGRSNIMKL